MSREHAERPTVEGAGPEASALDHADFWQARWALQAERSVLLYKALREVEKHCPCGARPESIATHPHVGGCPVGEAFYQCSILKEPEKP